MTFVDGKELYTRRFSKSWIRRDINKLIDEFLERLPDCDIALHITLEYQVSIDTEDVKK